MRILQIRFTRGDSSTQPGGYIIRERDEEPYFLVHHFTRQPGSREPSSFFWGAYCNDVAEAVDIFEEKLERAKRYTAGGSLIPGDREAVELAAEARSVEA